jgi:hypothetical protein
MRTQGILAPVATCSANRRATVEPYTTTVKPCNNTQNLPNTEATHPVIFQNIKVAKYSCIHNDVSNSAQIEGLKYNVPSKSKI